MPKFSLKELPLKDLEALGLMKNDKLTLDQKSTDALLNGRVTDLLRLQNIKIDGLGVISLDAKLSMSRKDNGSVGLYVHPIYKERVAHPNLTPEENAAFSRGGVHVKQAAAYGKIIDHGSAKYQFDEKNSKSYYIQLEKRNGEKTTIWGVDLERALQASGKDLFDDVILEFKGKQFVTVEIDGKWETKERYAWEVRDYVREESKEKTFVYEFDKDTNSFIAVDSDDIIVPEEINGTPLTEEQKRKMKQGQVVEMSDGTAVQTSPAAAKNNFLQSNRKLLIASVLLDGGLSFFLVKGMQLVHNKTNQKKLEQQEYNKGYRDALAKVQADLERKSKEYPNDKEIVNDLNIVKAEFARAATSNVYDETEEKSINETKSVVNDPELDDNAERRERAEEHFENQQKRNETSADQNDDTKRSYGR